MGSSLIELGSEQGGGDIQHVRSFGHGRRGSGLTEGRKEGYPTDQESNSTVKGVKNRGGDSEKTRNARCNQRQGNQNKAPSL